jgi:NAD(P)-dependent dehydrogenase (short-subunit alcohol dehydrogenase family)
MGDRFKGKSAVVTGGGGGIGRATALAFATEGANVLVADYGSSRGGEGSDASPAEKVVCEIKSNGGNAVAHFANVADFKAAEGIIDSCVKNFGRIDILVNLAGILRERMMWNMTEDEWDTVIAVHLKGTFNCSRRAAALMREQRYGRIVNVTSEAWRGTIGQSNYCAAKGGIVSFTRAIAKELGKYGVTANAIAPLAGTRMTVTPEVIASATKQYEMGVVSKEFYETSINMPGPEYVAPLFLYLASDKAANINGKIFHITRGKVAIYHEPVEQFIIYKTDAGGMWTLEDLEKYVPSSLLVGYVNSAPPEPPKEKK